MQPHTGVSWWAWRNQLTSLFLKIDVVSLEVNSLINRFYCLPPKQGADDVDHTIPGVSSSGDMARVGGGGDFQSPVKRGQVQRVNEDTTTTATTATTATQLCAEKHHPHKAQPRFRCKGRGPSGSSAGHRGGVSQTPSPALAL